MKYTINGKEYTEFDIKKRCAELMELNHLVRNTHVISVTECHGIFSEEYYEPDKEIEDTWPIIEKIWDELNESCLVNLDYMSKWNEVIEKHNCTKLVAACILFVEIDEDKL